MQLPLLKRIFVDSAGPQELTAGTCKGRDRCTVGSRGAGEPSTEDPDESSSVGAGVSWDPSVHETEGSVGRRANVELFSSSSSATGAASSAAAESPLASTGVLFVMPASVSKIGSDKVPWSVRLMFQNTARSEPTIEA